MRRSKSCRKSRHPHVSLPESGCPCVTFCYAVILALAPRCVQIVRETLTGHPNRCLTSGEEYQNQIREHCLASPRQRVIGTRLRKSRQFYLLCRSTHLFHSCFSALTLNTQLLTI